jgi:hypothetical protein
MSGKNVWVTTYFTYVENMQKWNFYESLGNFPYTTVASPGPTH